jgi:hypothetical protein
MLGHKDLTGAEFAAGYRAARLLCSGRTAKENHLVGKLARFRQRTGARRGGQASSPCFSGLLGRVMAQGGEDGLVSDPAQQPCAVVVEYR